jgi:hypothetical protein
VDEEPEQLASNKEGTCVHEEVQVGVVLKYAIELEDCTNKKACNGWEQRSNAYVSCVRTPVLSQQLHLVSQQSVTSSHAFEVSRITWLSNIWHAEWQPASMKKPRVSLAGRTLRWSVASNRMQQ